MAERTVIVRLREDQVDGAGDLMTRVFVDQLQAVGIDSSEEQRRAYLDGYLRVVRYFLAHGEPWVASIDNRVVGLALWIPPHVAEPVEEEAVEFGVHELSAIFREALGGVYAVDRLLGAEREKIEQPYWFLPSRLDVDPAHTGKGIASSLLRPVLLRADEGRVRCYAETIVPPMVPFLRKHGFEIMSEGVEPTGNVRYWMLIREPART